jgi:tetratricopeptide (TPR) repeat protein
MKKRIIGVAAIILVVFFIYLPAIRGGFVWDDDSFLTENPLIKAGNGLFRFWFTTEPPDYFPLTSTMLWLEWRLFSMNAAGYHIVNVLLHILSALLIWLVLDRLKVPGGWLAALIFAIHPVNVESVAWITQHKSTLPMVLYLLSLLLYLKFEKTKQPRDYVFSLGVFLSALLSKTSVIMLPLVLLGCAWWQREKIERKDIRRSIPFFALSAILSLVTVWFQYNRSIGEDIVRIDSFLSRLAGAGWAVWFYLYKAILPFNLSFVYPRWKIDTASFFTFLPGILLAGLFLLFWRYRKQWGRPFLFGFGYFVVTLFPVMGFFNIYFMRYSFVADHYQYVSIIGIIALLAGLGDFAFNKLRKELRNWAVAAIVFLIGLLCLQTWRQAHIYKDSETIFSDAIAKDPNCWIGNYNLGRFFQDNKRYIEAKKYYSEALRIDPKNPDPINNTGNILLEEGKIEEAIKTFRLALEVKPEFAESHYNLGCAFLEAKRYQEAIDEFYEALRIQPKNVRAHNNLGNALASQGRFNQAIAHYTEALRIRPKFVDAHVNLGIVLRRQQKYNEAIKHFAAALRIQPDNLKARQNLAYIRRLLEESKRALPKQGTLKK